MKILYLEETKYIFNDVTSRYIHNANNCNNSQVSDRFGDEIILNYKIYQFIETREYLLKTMNPGYKNNKILLHLMKL